MDMLKYTLRRLIQGLITVLIIATIVFLLMRLLPTDYYFTEDQLMKLTDEQKNDLLRAAGLLDPLWKQLLTFYNNLIHFEFGNSSRIQNGIAVVTVIGSKFAISMKMGAIALVISLFVGVALGIAQALFKDGIVDYLGTAYTIFVNAVPSLVSYSLILVIGANLLGLPSTYSTRNNTGLSMILPITCLTLASIASYALWTRRYIVDEMNKDYVKLARVKGLSKAQLTLKHVFRNAFVPLAAYIPASFLHTISGSLLAERFFSVPGMGPLLTDAISRYDLNIVQTLVILYGSLGVLGVFLGDIAMMLMDPRISLTGKGGGAR